MRSTTTPKATQPFEVPKFRQFLGVVGLIWLAMVAVLIVVELIESWTIDLNDPLLTPVFYIVLFGGSSLWLWQQYRHHHIEPRQLLGDWPSGQQWPALIGLWVTLFMFSLGAFQVSFAAFSYLLPQMVEDTLQSSIFLGADETAIPWLYNLLMLIVLVVAAPVLEEFLFRGFLLHRWGTRWNLRVAVLLSSVLFGILHANLIGLTGFGFALALLYLRSSNLWLVIIIHSLNNAIAAGLEIILSFGGSSEPQSLTEFRSSIWFGLVLLAISTPFLIRFLRQNWAVTRAPLPYFANGDRAGRLS
ncbi:MAG: CPBP family intramembrane glutamic endopeptidase [Cyanobacteria bacterium P01_A01_bin.70]